MGCQDCPPGSYQDSDSHTSDDCKLCEKENVNPGLNCTVCPLENTLTEMRQTMCVHITGAVRLVTASIKLQFAFVRTALLEIQ